MGEEMVQRDLIATRKIGEVLRELVLHLELALLLQFQNCRSRELFGDGADAGFGVRSKAGAAGHIGEAVTLFEKNSPILGDQHRRTRSVVRDDVSEERIN